MSITISRKLGDYKISELSVLQADKINIPVMVKMILFLFKSLTEAVFTFNHLGFKNVAPMGSLLCSFTASTNIPGHTSFSKFVLHPENISNIPSAPKIADCRNRYLSFMQPPTGWAL